VYPEDKISLRRQGKSRMSKFLRVIFILETGLGTVAPTLLRDDGRLFQARCCGDGENYMQPRVILDNIIKNTW
jgi:hypothetical protein